MTPRAWSRVAAAAGIGWLVLQFASVALTNTTDIGAPRAEVAELLAEVEPVRFHTASVLHIVGLLLLVVFAAHLRERLAGSGERGVSAPLATAAFGGVLIHSAAFSVRFPLLEGVVRRANDGLDTTTAAALLDAAAAASWVAITAFALFLAATAVVVLSTGAMPRWLGWSAAVLAVVLVPSLPLAGSGLPHIPATLSSVWVLAVAVMMLRGQEPARAPQTATLT